MTDDLDVDVLVAGAGAGGSLTALLLNQIGLRVMLVERGSHPRFAIGESSTPIARIVLSDLANEYGLPFLLPLSKYGVWKQSYPDLVCGPKRGFSYFQHRAGAAFPPQTDHADELLVAASHSIETADTHWLRSDVDAFLASKVRAAGIPYFDATELTVQETEPVWRLKAQRQHDVSNIEAAFVIDATGEAAFIPRTLKLNSGVDQMRTRSRALFAHFTGVTPWHDMLTASQSDTAAHPFRCDDAALHHLLQEGWMWQLRFDNGVTSVGIVLDAARRPADTALSVQQEWDGALRNYPSLASQFAGAQVVAPAQGLCRTGRLQRRWLQAAGSNWALLPGTAGFIDPLYSTGLAHTICGVEQLVHRLKHHWRRESLGDAMQQYNALVQSELDLMDELVHGSYLALQDFQLFVPYSMLYFAAATTYERRRLQTGFSPDTAFLCAGDTELRRVVQHVRQELTNTLQTSPGDAPHFFKTVAQSIAPYNTAGLCDHEAGNMYRYTVPEIDD